MCKGFYFDKTRKQRRKETQNPGEGFSSGLEGEMVLEKAHRKLNGIADMSPHNLCVEFMSINSVMVLHSLHVIWILMTALVITYYTFTIEILM